MHSTCAYTHPALLYSVQRVLNPVENGTDLVTDNITQLRVLINRIKVDSQQSTSPLTMKLNGTLDAAVNGGVSKFEVLENRGGGGGGRVT